MTTLAGEFVDLKSLIPGSLVEVETRSRHYLIECLGGNSIRISGHPDYCPMPVPAELGSVSEEGVVEIGLIGPGLPLMIMLDGVRPITTSRVLRIWLDEAENRADGPSRIQ